MKILGTETARFSMIDESDWYTPVALRWRLEPYQVKRYFKLASLIDRACFEIGVTKEGCLLVDLTLLGRVQYSSEKIAETSKIHTLTSELIRLEASPDGERLPIRGAIFGDDFRLILAKSLDCTKAYVLGDLRFSCFGDTVVGITVTNLNDTQKDGIISRCLGA